MHGHGGAIAAQLWHQGAERGDADGIVPVSPSGVNSLGEPKGRALRTDELAGVAGSFAAAARNARDVGFDAVELHGAHGYLLDEFLWARTNLRTDGYGGDLTARTRFPAEVVAAVRAAVGPDFPIIFRFSQWKQTDYAASIAGDPAELQELLAPLVDAGVDMFHPSTRRHHESGLSGRRSGTQSVGVDEEGHRSTGDRGRLGGPGDGVHPGPARAAAFRLRRSTVCSISTGPASSTSSPSDGPCSPIRPG